MGVVDCLLSCVVRVRSPGVVELTLSDVAHAVRYLGQCRPVSSRLESIMKILQTAAEVAKAIVSIASRGATPDGDIHTAGVAVLYHAAEHGDATLADKLVHAMPKGGRKLALVEWMLAFGMLSKLDPKADKEAIASGRLFK